MCSTHGICYHGLVLKGDVLEGTELPAGPSQCSCDLHMTNIQEQLSPLLVPNFKSIHMIKGGEASSTDLGALLNDVQFLACSLLALTRLYVLERNVNHKPDKISIRIG